MAESPRMDDAVKLPLITFVPALAASAVLTLLARRIALRAGLVAAVRPDGIHQEPRPYGGGLAIAATLALFLGFSVFIPEIQAAGTSLYELTNVFPLALPTAARLALGGLLFFVIGLIDDRWALKAAPKLGLQFLAAGIIVLGFGIKTSIGAETPGLAEVVSILWVVAVVNAVNLFDHADGLAGAACLVAFASLAVGQFLAGEVVTAGMALVAAGAVAGFLIYNVPPARLFLGDTGAGLLGFLFAGLTMTTRYGQSDLGSIGLPVLVPVALMAVPLFDMICSLGSRLVRRQSPLAGDATCHLGHRMLARGWRPQGIVLFVAVVSMVAGAGSVAMYAEVGQTPIPGCAAVVLAVAMVAWVRRSGAEKGAAGAFTPESLACWLRRGSIVLCAAGLLVLPQISCNVAFAWGVPGSPGPVFAMTLGLGFWLVPILLMASWAAERRIVLPHPWLLVPAALAVAAVVVSTAAADDKASAFVRGAQVAGMWVAMASLAQALRGDGERRFLLGCLVAAAAAAAVLAIRQQADVLPATWEEYAKNRPEILDERHIRPGSWGERALVTRYSSGVQASLRHPDLLAALLVMGFFAAAGLAREKWSEIGGRAARTLAILMAILAALSAVGIFLAQSRAGEAALVAGAYWLAVAWWVKRKRLRVILYVLPLSVGAAGLAAAWQLDGPSASSALLALQHRAEYWQSTLQILRTDWLTGVGLENFGSRYLEYKLPQAAEEISDPHNLVLSVWSILGLAGLAAVASLAVVTVRSWRKPDGETDRVEVESRSTVSLPSFLGPVAIVAGPAILIYYMEGLVWGLAAMAGMIVVVTLASIEDPSRMVATARPIRSVRTACIVGLAVLALMDQVGAAALELPTAWAMLILVVVSLGSGGHCGLRIGDRGSTEGQGLAGDAISSIRNPWSVRLGPVSAFGLMMVAMALGFGYVRGLMVPVIREDALITAALGAGSREPRSVSDIDVAMQTAAENPVAWEPAWLRARVWLQTTASHRENLEQGLARDKADEALREALQRRPRFRQAWLALADNALMTPEANRNPTALRLALDDLREALRLYPTSVTTHCRIGMVQDSLDDYAEAAREYREALRLDDLLPADYRRLSPLDRRKVESRLAELESLPDAGRKAPAAPAPAGQ
jgi:UDP-GlcNAc:undecaprenyl-phosphate/decaprenyl-phosphate GlcNAc-1-phosphate transferase